MSENSADWRYCTCSHKADDHNPCSLACYKCDCSRWKADIEKSRQEMEKRLPVTAFDDYLKRRQTKTDRELYDRIIKRVEHLDL